jgi:FHA domain
MASGRIDETSEGATESSRASFEGRPSPGVLIVFSGGRAVFHPMPLVGGRLVLGRDALEPAVVDTRLSRVHARVTLEGGAWRVHDLGSRNGTFVRGEPVEGVRAARAGDVIRPGPTTSGPVTSPKRASPPLAPRATRPSSWAP